MDLIYRFLPPPSYLDFPVVGLDVSDRSIKFIELKDTRRGLRLNRFGMHELAPGIIVAGEIKKTDELSGELSAIFKPLNVRHVAAALPEERAYISVITLPRFDRSQARGVIELELPQKIPLPIEETIFDFEFMPQSKITTKDAVISENQVPHQDAIVYAFPRSLVESYLDVYLKAGLTPVVFTMETISLGRALLPSGETGPPTMIVDFGKTRVSFVIVADGLVRFSSTVSVAGEALDQAIAKALKISLSEAEEIKKKKGMSKDPDNKAVFDAILPVVSAVADEIERHVLFWNTHAEHVHKSLSEISKVMLSGGDANLIGLPEYLSRTLKLPVETGNPWINISSFEDYIPEIKSNEALAFSAAIGLGLAAAENN